jgi:hypothetical protein
MSERPDPSEFAPSFAGYVKLVPEGDILACLAAQPGDLRRLLAGIPPERETHRYAPGKWSIREVLGHVCDAERVFGYRALCVGRGDKTALPGFDENDYAAASGADTRPLPALLEELERARLANLDVLRHLPEAAWRHLGTANHGPLSVRGQAYVMAGHVLHHMGVLRDRYGAARP